MDGEMNVSQGSDIDATASSTQSPANSTFSMRGHVRCSSSVSSVDPLASPLLEVPSSPAFTGNVAGKRSLPDVQEEEPAEREEHHFEKFDDHYDVYDWSCK